MIWLSIATTCSPVTCAFRSSSEMFSFPSWVNFIW